MPNDHATLQIPYFPQKHIRRRAKSLEFADLRQESYVAGNRITNNLKIFFFQVRHIL